MYYVKVCFIISCLALIAGCQDVSDDLAPSNNDNRPTVEAGSTGTLPGQTSPTFTATDTLSNSHMLEDELALADGIVLYFTMWCPVCDSHMSHIRRHLVDDFPNVTFFVVDFVTGSVAASRSAQLASGYSDFIVLADNQHVLYDLYDGGMGTTIIIDSSGTVLFNEDYKDGSKVRETLETLP